MLESFIIAFRETLEAALVLGILFSILERKNLPQLRKMVLLGLLAGVIGSVIVWCLFILLAGGFHGRGEPIFEGITMLIGALLIAFMISLMSSQKSLERFVDKRLSGGIAAPSVFLLSLSVVLREGVETVIFLFGAAFNGGSDIIGALGGIVIAAALGIAFALGAKKIPAFKVFIVSSVLLGLFGAGLFSQSIHEFIEVGILPATIDPLYDVTAIVNATGMSTEGNIGGILHSILGFDPAPALLQTLGYGLYLTVVMLLARKSRRVTAVSG